MTAFIPTSATFQHGDSVVVTAGRYREWYGMVLAEGVNAFGKVLVSIRPGSASFPAEVWVHELDLELISRRTAPPWPRALSVVRPAPAPDSSLLAQS